MTLVLSGSNGVQLPLGSAASPAETNTTAQATGAYFPSSTTYGISTNGTNALYIDASQNVGVGTTSPSTKLTVSTAATTDAVRWTDNTNSTGLLSTTTGASTMWATAALAFGTGAASFTERMRIDSSGNVGIGTSSPSTYGKLVVNGNICPIQAPSSNWGVDFASGSTSGTYVTLANNATYDLSAGSGFVTIYEDSGLGAIQYACVFGNTSIIWQYNSIFSNVSGTAGKVNVYYNSGVTRYRIQNLYGSTVYLYISTVRNRYNV